MGKKTSKNKSTPLRVSVVVGAYNEETYLPKLLESLKNQTRKPDEIIIVDNNSTDNTAKIAKEFGATVLKEKEQGYVYAVHRGLMAAMGDVIAVTDADVILPENWLSEIVSVFCDNPSVVGVTSSMDLWDSKLFSFLTRHIYNKFVKLHFSLNIPYTGGMSMAIRRDVLHKVGGYDFRYKTGADLELGTRLKSHGTVQFLPQIMVKASSRRFQKDAVRSSIKYTKAYVYTFWLRRPVEDSLTPFR